MCKIHNTIAESFPGAGKAYMHRPPSALLAIAVAIDVAAAQRDPTDAARAAALLGWCAGKFAAHASKCSVENSYPSTSCRAGEGEKKKAELVGLVGQCVGAHAVRCLLARRRQQAPGMSAGNRVHCGMRFVVSWKLCLGRCTAVARHTVAAALRLRVPRRARAARHPLRLHGLSTRLDLAIYK